MGNTSETRTYDALLSTTLENWAKGISDTVTTSNFAYWQLKKSGSWQSVSALGERCKYSLRYRNGNSDSYSGYDPIDVTPIDGMTAAFYNWVQFATSISISRIEERKNAGEYQMLDLLEEKSQQAMDGIVEKFNKAFLQGNGINSATAITTAYTSPVNNSVFLTPLPLLVGQTPSSGTIGGIAANVSDNGVSWWQNQKIDSTDTNYASHLKDLTKLKNNCSKGSGGAPDIYLADQSEAEFYEAALRSQNRYTDYTRADVPFDNITLFKQPLVWDEFMPNWSGTTTVQSATAGTVVALNSKFIQMKYDAQTNFITTPFVRPVDQDAKSATILWYGCVGVNNRRKHGVLSGIDTTLTS